MNESLWPRLRLHRESHPHLWFSVRAQPRGAHAANRTLRGIALRHRIVRPPEQIRSASMFLANAHSSPGSATRVPVPTRKAETFPRNQLLGEEEHEAKRLA